MSRAPSNVIPFKQRVRPVVKDTPTQQAEEALTLMLYLSERLRRARGIPKRTRSELREMAEDSAHLLREAIAGKAVQP